MGGVRGETQDRVMPPIRGRGGEMMGGLSCNMVGFVIWSGNGGGDSELV
jgi:hypothetical protein